MRIRAGSRLVISARRVGGERFDFGAEFFGHLGGELRGLVADGEFDDERFLVENFVEALAFIEFGNFKKQNGERRGRIEILGEGF